MLALGNLLPRIRALYAAEEIDRATVRHLTLASKSQQKAWLALVDDPSAYVPTGHQLKAWLFGGQSIAVRHALFDVDGERAAIVADLFGEDALFRRRRRVLDRAERRHRGAPRRLSGGGLERRRDRSARASISSMGI